MSDLTPKPPEPEQARMKLFRAEIQYLTANGWLCYVPGVQDPVTGYWKCWADKNDPQNIIDQDEAVNIQKRRDLEKDKEHESHK